MPSAAENRQAPHGRAPLQPTRALAAQVCGLRFSDLPSDILERTRHCLLDFVGCAIAGAQEEPAGILLADLLEDGGGICSVIAHNEQLPPLQAALVNGTAGHALDYDDCVLVLPGHLSVTILPALLAAAEQHDLSCAELVTAFVAGFELGCRVSRMVAPSHYARGYHATSTVGGIAAAAACARLMVLSETQTSHALGIAATQAAGLKGMFGTMCKPLHAGKAAQIGLLSARLAARGFESSEEPLAGEAGFAAVMAAACAPELALEPPPGGFYLRDNLFKYHASCYGTQGAVDAARKAAARIAPDAEIARCVVRVGADNRNICAIDAPRTANEAKFSVRLMVALALAGLDTSSLQTYTDSQVTAPAVTRLRDRIEVIFDPLLTMTQARLVLEDNAGNKVSAEHDSGLPSADLEEQRRKLVAKFHALADPLMGVERSKQVEDRIGELEHAKSIQPLLQLLRLDRC